MSAPYIQDGLYGILTDMYTVSANHLLRSKLFELVSKLYLDLRSYNTMGFPYIALELLDGDAYILLTANIVDACGDTSIILNLDYSGIDGQSGSTSAVLPITIALLEAKEHILSVYIQRENTNLSFYVSLEELSHPIADAVQALTLMEKTFALSIKLTGDYEFTPTYYASSDSSGIVFGLASYEARSLDNNVVFSPLTIETSGGGSI